MPGNMLLKHRAAALLVLSPIVTQDGMTHQCWTVKEMDFGAGFEWITLTLNC